MLGLAVPMFGPALTHLRERAGVSVGAIGILFTMQAFGTLVGSGLGGRAADRWGGHSTLRLGLAVLALGALAVPVLPSLVAIGAAALVIGVGAAFIDVAGNTLVVWARSGASGPALNALHLCFGVGALAVPVAINRSVAWSSSVWPFAVLVTIGAALVAQWVRRAPEPSPPAASRRAGRPAPSRFALVVLAAFFLVYVGAEVGFGSWIYTYTDELAIGGDTTPALVTTVFSFMFMLGRVIAIGVSRRVSPGPILVMGTAVALVGCTAMVLGDGRTATVWLGAAVVGFGLAPLFPTAIALADRRLSLDGGATAWVIAGSSLGGLALPLLFGVLIDRRGATAMPAAVLVTLVAMAVVGIGLGRVLHGARAGVRSGTGTDAVPRHVPARAADRGSP